MHRRAVTIVEVLVVVGVIALLIGLLAPALSSVGSAGRSARCQANLRQMAIAANSYAALYDAYPAAIRYENSDGVFRRIAWDWVTTFSNELISPGPLWSFTDHPGEVQQCPEFSGASTFGGDPFTGYNYNTSYIGGEAPFPTVGWEHLRRGVPPHGCARSASCAVFGCGGWKGGANKFMRAPLNHEGLALSTLYAGGQAFRHGGSTNASFLDGHVAASHEPRKGKHATTQNLAQIMDYPANGFLSNDDAAYDPR